MHKYLDVILHLYTTRNDLKGSHQEQEAKWREEYGEGKESAHDPKPPHHLSDMVEALLWHRLVWQPVELGDWYLLMTWLLIEAEGWFMKCIGWYYLLRISQIHFNHILIKELQKWCHSPILIYLQIYLDKLHLCFSCREMSGCVLWKRPLTSHSLERVS